MDIQKKHFGYPSLKMEVKRGVAPRKFFFHRKCITDEDPNFDYWGKSNNRHQIVECVKGKNHRTVMKRTKVHFDVKNCHWLQQFICECELRVLNHSHLSDYVGGGGGVTKFVFTFHGK